MRGRGLLAIFLVLLLSLFAGVVYLGLYPPTPRQNPVQKVVPNEKFQPR